MAVVAALADKYEGIMDRVKALCLSDFVASDVCLRAAFEALLRASPSLSKIQELSLSNCNILDFQCFMRSMSVYFHELKRLDLSRNSALFFGGSCSSECMNQNFVGLRTLISLNLSDTCMHDLSPLAILSHCPSLRELILANNHICHNQSLLVQPALCFDSVKCLTLDGNSRPIPWDALCTLFPRLCVLSLTDTVISVEDRNVFSLAVEKLTLSGCSIMHLSVLFHFLALCPALKHFIYRRGPLASNQLAVNKLSMILIANLSALETFNGSEVGTFYLLLSISGLLPFVFYLD